MFKLLIGLPELKEIKRSEISGDRLLGSSTFLFKKTMEDLEVKLDQMATYLAEIMLSQLGFSFVPKVKFALGGIFTVTVDFPEEETDDVSFYFYEPLCFIHKGGCYGLNWS